MTALKCFAAHSYLGSSLVDLRLEQRGNIVCTFDDAAHVVALASLCLELLLQSEARERSRRL